MKNALLITSALILPLCIAGCNKSEQTAAIDSAGNAADAVDATASNAMVDVKQALSVTPAAQEFINIAGKSDAYEVAAAKLALTNAASADVKAFADEMIKAHTESTAKIKAAAAKASPALTPDPTLTTEQNDDLADLAKKKGAEFDEDYIDEQVDAHQSALALMRDYAEHGETPSLKVAAGEIAPVVQKHLDHVKMLDK